MVSLVFTIYKENIISLHLFLCILDIYQCHCNYYMFS